MIVIPEELCAIEGRFCSLMLICFNGSATFKHSMLHVPSSCTLYMYITTLNMSGQEDGMNTCILEEHLRKIRQLVQTLLVARLCNQMLTCFDGSATLNHSNQYLPVLTSSGYECLQLHIF
ncbi:hypothetical protein OS493_032183 [Desmophyllum pertusum]|uniref:Uncharacterized protein n=1 Tax=Desmophyllum pertusum TaxID=174260 RepID=A0A9W9ZX26_9CNID|nr:hypothetical protein OS493_032183 [Desmophyllum pertusum]